VIAEYYDKIQELVLVFIHSVGNIYRSWRRKGGAVWTTLMSARFPRWYPL